MEFRIADTFTDSLARLTNDEQKAVKTTAFDLQMNPANPGMQFHKLDKARDKHFWSVRVTRDIRLIVHRTESSLLLCYVDHHDDAYHWAERRKLETHPRTGAAQLVEIRERVEEIPVRKYVEVEEQAADKKPVFADISDDELLKYGVPEEWLRDVSQANEDSILEIADHLPAEAAEAVLDLATGVKPQIAHAAAEMADPFAHPDAQRRFRVMRDGDELARALDYPWEKWTVFLHPAQRELVERDYKGPARVAGSAGTGKTVVALHRAVFLVRSNPDTRVLLATFSDPLANALRNKLISLIGEEPRLGERLEIYGMNSLGERLYRANFGRFSLVSRETLREILEEAAGKIESNKFSSHFLLSEWEQVVDAWQLITWEAYRDVVRLGRKTRLPEERRKVLWSIFEQVRLELESRKLLTHAGMFCRLAEHYQSSSHLPFDYAVVDEAQDIDVPQLRFLAALGRNRDNSLFFAGDLGQRIFQQPFSWKSLGVDVRGRSHILRINYRTSHQIRRQADHLLGPELADVDGNVEDRRGTVSVFNGPNPTVRILDNPEEEGRIIADWLAGLVNEEMKPHEIGLFVRSEAELKRARSAVEQAGLQYKVLDKHVETASGCVSIGTMHLAKGLEFRAVVVMACDDEVLPLQSRIETVTDDSDLEEVYNTERHLLYVACTRARDRLIVTGVEPASEFLDDLKI
jgi:mRNA-degrading endonuclease RelE of RelBE toxin-antitoxin system